MVRWLEVDLSRLERGDAAGWSRVAPSFDEAPRAVAWAQRLATCPGLAAGLARLALAPAGDVPFVVAVGDAVRRGLPTAARASVLSRAPLTGRVGEGQIGSDLGRRLARSTDVLVVRGRATRPGSVLVLERGGAPRLASFPELRGLDADAAGRALVARLGPCATLRVGPAGEAGSPLAHLAAGSEPSSRAGRGGLGGAFGARGLKALAVLDPPCEDARDRALVELLQRSPRLAARADGGTFELGPALAAGGALRGDEGAALLADARAAADGKHGCRGCPTPCGWTFSTGAAAGAEGAAHKRGMRFAAHYALGADLGLGFDDGARLLARCDHLGIDAKEAGAALAVLARARATGALAGGPVDGDRATFERWLDELAAGVGEAACARDGARAAARALGLSFTPRDAADAEAGHGPTLPAAALARHVAVRGSEPMRAFPFLDGLDARRIARALAPLAVPPGIDDPLAQAGKGRLVWWHENLAAALDATGFCAFSAAGLVADGVCTLDELAARVLPAELAAPDVAPGEALLALGEAVVGLHLELARSWQASLPEVGAAGPLAAPGVLDEYVRLRGVAPGGVPDEGLRARWGRGRLELPDELRVARAAAPLPGPADAGRSPGTVRLRAGGALAEALGGELEVALPLPATVGEVLEVAERQRPAARGWLVRDGIPLPVAWRAGRRLDAREPVRAGDALDLVLAVAGG